MGPGANPRSGLRGSADCPVRRDADKWSVSSISRPRRRIGQIMTVVSLQQPDLQAETPVKRIKLLIADDHPLMLAGIRRMVERRRPELVLMDLNMPGLTGMQCITRIRESWPETKVVVLSACDEPAVIDDALRAGASAYVLKSATTVDVASVVRQAFSGAVFHAPSNAPTRTNARQRAGTPALTVRERSILSAVATGLPTAAISRDLWVSEHTVKFHLTNIYRKLGVANRASAVRYAIEHDLVAAA
jgi:DNA-binding NarL/FixJ family response regulator